MVILLSPQRRGDELIAHVASDVLTVNGVEYDFSQLPDGGILPANAIDSEFFCGQVERIDGELHLTLLLPHGPNPTQEQAFPQPVHVVDGPVPLPQPVEENNL